MAQAVERSETAKPPRALEPAPAPAGREYSERTIDLVLNSARLVCSVHGLGADAV